MRVEWLTLPYFFLQISFVLSEFRNNITKIKNKLNKFFTFSTKYEYIFQYWRNLKRFSHNWKMFEIFTDVH